MIMNEAKLLEGKVLAGQIQAGIKNQIANLIQDKKTAPGMLAIQTTSDPSADWYINAQQKLAEKLGIRFIRTPASEIPDQAALLKKIEEANEQKDIHGIFISQPLPKNFDKKTIFRFLKPSKDVEGITPPSLGLIVLRESVLIPPTAYAAFKLLKSTGIELKGKTAVIVGQSAIVGRPLQMLLGEQRVTTIVCNSGTSSPDLKKFVSEADIVIGCAGQPELIKGAWIKPGAVVIDVGTTEVEGKLAGDVEFEEAKKRASFITPVPGGVGPLTVTMLMQNLMHAYEWQILGHSR